MDDLRERFAEAVARRFQIEGTGPRSEITLTFTARRRSNDQAVWVHVLLPELLRAIHKPRLDAHLGRLSDLSYRSIVPILEYGDTGRFTYYVTPAFSGQNLGEYRASHTGGTLPILRALAIARDVADALAYAHARRICHLSLTPQCIRIEGLAVLVADFGLWAVTAESADDAITAAGLVLGTPSYMSPEGAAGQTLDARSDVYSLGCVLYELVAGSPPHAGMTAAQVFARRLVEPPTSLGALGHDLPPLQRVLDRALAVRPSDRFQSPADFMVELDTLIDRAATTGLGPSKGSSWFRRLLRRRSPARGIGQAGGGVLFKDRYRVVRRLGEGGMAIVFLAVDTQLHRRVAIKVMRGTLAREVDIERFTRELVVTSQLSHPHVLQPIDFGEADGFPFYVMPYVENGSIRTRLHREGVFPMKDALTIAIITSDALQFVHDNGVVHRDIKPENILLHEGYPMLADFGIAHSLRRAVDRLTKRGYGLGTPPYWSPEQMTGDEELDERSDIYSLAVVLYEMLEGNAFSRGVWLEPIAISRKHPPVVREGVRATLEQALDPLKDRRHRSAAAFRDDLRRLRRTLRSAGDSPD